MIGMQKMELSEICNKDISHMELSQDNLSLALWVEINGEKGRLYAIKCKEQSDLKTFQEHLKSRLDCGNSIITEIEIFERQSSRVIKTSYYIITFEDNEKEVIELSGDIELYLVVCKPTFDDLVGKYVDDVIIDGDVDMVDFIIVFNGIKFTVYISGYYCVLDISNFEKAISCSTITCIDEVNHNYPDGTKGTSLRFNTDCDKSRVLLFMYSDDDKENKIHLELDVIF